MTKNKRILLVDDTKSIHDDFRKILTPAISEPTDLQNARTAFFGAKEAAECEDEAKDAAPASAPTSYVLDSAFQGMHALDMVKAAIAEGNPYCVAFVDVRMPPGWDGIQTIKEFWKIDPDLHCVICTAYSDYSWGETVAELGHTDKLLILKKPFDPAEIRQTASAFAAKWNAAASERSAMEAVRLKEIEARAYASSLETLNKALSTSKASADRMSTMKSEFMFRLTSEISTHLNAILDRLIEDGRTEGLDEALDRSQRLLETVDKVIDFTHVEAGTLDIQSELCEVREIIDDVEQTFRARAEAKGLVLEVRMSDSVPTSVKTDPARLSQVLCQLIDNAIRYTDNGRVHLSVGTEATQSWDRVRLRFDVTDTGRGIGQDRVGHVFEPFSSRVNGELAEGSGLGLTVAKQVARLLGGDVHFDSLPGEGCTFTLRLEVKREERCSDEPRPNRQPSAFENWPGGQRGAG
ncbi:MAG: two-component system sensor histidine kinase/response regulator [Paracoccaceae bacterium]